MQSVVLCERIDLDADTDTEQVPSTWQHRELRVATKLHNGLQCCGGSVDTGTEYYHVVMRFDTEFRAWNEHVHKSECQYGYT